MTIEIRPETERLVRQEIASGHIGSVDDLIAEGVRALHARGFRDVSTPDATAQWAEAAARLRELRTGVTLGGMRMKDLAHQGHRF